MSFKPQHEKSVQDAKLGYGFNSNHYGIPGARAAYDAQVRQNEQLNAALLGGLNNPQGDPNGPQYQNRRERASLEEVLLMAGFTLATVACIGFAYLPISMAFGTERTGAGSFPPVIVTLLYGWIVSGIMVFRFIRDLIKAVKERIECWNNNRPSPNIPAMRFSGPGLDEIFQAFATSIFPVGFVLVLPIWMFQNTAAIGFSWALLLALLLYAVLLYFRLLLVEKTACRPQSRCQYRMPQPPCLGFSPESSGFRRGVGRLETAERRPQDRRLTCDMFRPS